MCVSVRVRMRCVCVCVCVCPRMKKDRLPWQRERMISRSSFIPSCRARALQRNRCQSQYEEAPRFGLMSEAWSSTGFPLVFAILAFEFFRLFSPFLSFFLSFFLLLFSFYFFFFFLFFFCSSYIYLPIYLKSFLYACVARARVHASDARAYALEVFR